MDRKGAKYSNSLKNELSFRVLEYYSYGASVPHYIKMHLTTKHTKGSLQYIPH